MRYITGMICVLSGLLLRYLAMRALGRDFQEIIQIPSRVVKKGLYKWLKHPAYWGSLMVIFGVSIMEPVAGIMLLSWAFYKSRMVIENEIIKRCNYG